MGRVTPNTWRWRDHDETAPVWPGRHQVLGATWSQESTNFAVRSPEATAMWVCLFDDDGTETRHQLTEHTLGVWHGAIPGVPVGQRYGLRADGPWDPGHGRRFNPEKLLLDPYSLAISGDLTPGPDPLSYDARRPSRRSTVDSAAAMPRSVVVHDTFDWGEDRPLRTRWRDTVIYELHVKGFTELHNEIPQHLRGTYAGLGSHTVTRYLNDLGVTAVELLPVHHFFTEPGVADRGLVNYWGYNSIGFLAPHAAYSSTGDRGQQVAEFKQMVRNFHAAGIEVFLDVVYNHTAEGGQDGPSYSFRGLDDPGFYKRSGTPRDAYWDVTGCGNTVDSTNPGALRLILDSLRYWASEMHVDGFRFDLASALARTGHDIDMTGAFLTCVAQDPVLRHVKLIAEPWDASMDGYRVGSFPPPWTEWNDRYRDTVRDFWRGASAGVPRARQPDGGVLRPLRRRRPVAVRLGELRDRPRRVHGPRRRVLRVQAQRGQRRGQPRRLLRQPLVEPRCRGRDRRSGDHRHPPSSGGEPDDHALPLQRLPDDHRGRRARAHPGRQQQRLLPGQRGLLARLAGGRRVARRLRPGQGRAATAT